MTARRAERLPLKVRVTYEHLDDFLDDYSANVSLGGMFVRSDDPLPVGARFRLRFDIPGRERPVQTTGEVRWIVEPGDAAGLAPGMGIRFEPLSQADQKDVARWLRDAGASGA